MRAQQGDRGCPGAVAKKRQLGKQLGSELSSRIAVHRHGHIRLPGAHRVQKRGGKATGFGRRLKVIRPSEASSTALIHGM